MGCFPLLRACTTGSRAKIKVMTVDGRCLRLPTPIIVKEVLMDHPSHALFLSDSVRSLGVRARPLHSTASLQPGAMYFLLPEPVLAPRSHPAALTAETAAVPPSSQRTRQRRVSFALPSAEDIHSPSREESGTTGSDHTLAICKGAAATERLRKAAVEVLPAPSEGVLRLRMVVSKKQLGSVLREGGGYTSVVEGLLAPLLKEAAAAAKSRRMSCNMSRRPSLQSIPELCA